MHVHISNPSIPALVVVCRACRFRKFSSSSSCSHFASSTAAAGAMSPGQSGYRDQRTWPAFKPRARPLFCLTSLGMFAVVLVDDVRYQEREGRNRDKAEGACEFLRLNSACDLCVCAAPNAKLSLFWPRSLESLSMQ